VLTLLLIEIGFMLLAGLFAMAAVPWLRGFPPAWPLFLVGVLMTMSFIALYALANLGGKRMSTRLRLGIGLVAYTGAFWSDFTLAAGMLYRGDALPLRAGYVMLGPALLGLLLALVAALRAKPGERGAAAAAALYMYSLPMLGVRYLLVPLVSVNPWAQLIAVQTGAFYLFLRGVLRIYRPTSAEGNEQARPLMPRPVPDRVVGLVEGTTRRSARPFATRSDGTLDEQAISITCRPEDVPGVAQKVKEALADQPFLVETGVAANGKVELVIRPAQVAEARQDS